MSAKVIPITSAIVVDQAWHAFNDHANRIFSEPDLAGDPEWEAERQRLHAAFYAVFTGKPVELGNVIYARFR